MNSRAIATRTAYPFAAIDPRCRTNSFLETRVPLEREIVERTGLYLGSPSLTLSLVGVLEILLGLWLVTGFRERAACLVTSLFLAVLTVLVVVEEPSLLLGPFGGIAKDAALFVVGWIVWCLSDQPTIRKTM